MMHLNEIVTSTPIGGPASNFLKQAQWKNIMQDSQYKKSKIFLRFDSPDPRRNLNYFPKYEKVKIINKQLLEKRRCQAIEAMQIAEQRRLRLLEQEKKDAEMISQKFEKMSLAHVEDNCRDILPDGRLRLDKKRLIARRMKEKRIKMHLAEQERRKKLERSKRGRHLIQSPIYRVPQRSKSFRVSRNLIRDYTASEKKTNRRELIRYTKDELRALNPYGYYFM
jgi:hypothetical protein